MDAIKWKLGRPGIAITRNTRNAPAPTNGIDFTALPPELLEEIARRLPLPALKNFRLINRKANNQGAVLIKSLKVTNQKALEKAVSAFKARGITSLTLSGNFTDRDLRNLPQSLPRLVIQGCPRLTDAALRKLLRTIQVIHVDRQR